jgi:hypothetical protein
LPDEFVFIYESDFQAFPLCLQAAGLGTVVALV